MGVVASRRSEAHDKRRPDRDRRHKLTMRQWSLQPAIAIRTSAEASATRPERRRGAQINSGNAQENCNRLGRKPAENVSAPWKPICSSPSPDTIAEPIGDPPGDETPRPKASMVKAKASDTAPRVAESRGENHRQHHPPPTNRPTLPIEQDESKARASPMPTESVRGRQRSLCGIGGSVHDATPRPCLQVKQHGARWGMRLRGQRHQTEIIQAISTAMCLSSPVRQKKWHTSSGRHHCALRIV